MGCSIFQLRQQRIVGRLLLFGQGDGVVAERDRGIQVDGLIHLAAFQHTFGAQVIQYCAADAPILQLVQGAGAAAQQRHRRQLLCRRLWLLRQRTHQLIGVFGVTGKLLLQHRGHTVCRHGGLILRTVRDNRLDGLVVGAESALL